MASIPDRGRPAALPGPPPQTLDELTRGTDAATWVGLAYGSFLMAQIVVPIVLVIRTREKSECSRFHAAQAQAVQVGMMAAMMLYVCLFLAVWLWGFTRIASAPPGPTNEPPAFAVGMLVIIPLHFLM